jgi:probable O-glycosylation ligase (exosortase A-associated)
MRDLIVFLVFATLLPACFLRPWFGLMTFTWLAYNRTQDLTWGFARSLPISQLVGLFMIAGWMVWEFRPILGRDARLRAMVLLVLLIGVSMATSSLRVDLVLDRYMELIKVILVALLTAALLVDRERLRQFGLVLSLALGFYGVKSGLFFLFTGGGTINGPGGMLLDNNDFALANTMNLPFLWYMSGDLSDVRFGRPLKYLLRVAFVLTILTVLATGSRGGFLAMGVTLFIMAMKTRFKVPALVGVAVMGLLALALAPPEFIDRLRSITNASEDPSAQARFISWQVAVNMIKAHPFFGVGFQNMFWEFPRYLTGIYVPEGTKVIENHVAHNSYLQIWAESGTFAYLVFMFILVSTIRRVRRISRVVKGTPEAWAGRYSLAIEVTLYGYMVGATFLNRAHFDLVYQLVAVAVALPLVIAAERERSAARRRRTGPAPARDVWVRHADPFAKLPGA